LQVQFRRGSTKLHWKTAFDSDGFYEGEFLKKDVAKRVLKGSLPASRTAPRGICCGKKADIIAKLCPLMPVNRQQFWKTLPESATASDLLNNFE